MIRPKAKWKHGWTHLSCHLGKEEKQATPELGQKVRPRKGLDANTRETGGCRTAAAHGSGSLALLSGGAPRSDPFLSPGPSRNPFFKYPHLPHPFSSTTASRLRSPAHPRSSPTSVAVSLPRASAMTGSAYCGKYAGMIRRLGPSPLLVSSLSVVLFVDLLAVMVTGRSCVDL